MTPDDRLKENKTMISKYVLNELHDLSKQIDEDVNEQTTLTDDAYSLYAIYAIFRVLEHINEGDIKASTLYQTILDREIFTNDFFPNGVALRHFIHWYSVNTDIDSIEQNALLRYATVYSHDDIYTRFRYLMMLVGTYSLSQKNTTWNIVSLSVASCLPRSIINNWQEFEHRFNKEFDINLENY